VVELKEIAKERIEYIILALALLTVFIFAIQSNTQGNFYEFDPYMYTELVKILAIHGSIPISGLAYPCGASCSSNRFGVIVPYWLAGYLKGTNLPLYQIANMYPPIMLILMALLLFAFFKTKPAKITAVLLLISIPVIFQQFTGGMFQEEAIGFMSVIAVFVSTYFAFTKKESIYSIVAGIIYMGSLLGSKYFTVTSTILPAILLLYALYLFAVKDNENLKHIIKASTIITLFAFVSNLGLLAYHGGFALSGFSIGKVFIPINIVLLAFALIIAVILYFNHLGLTIKGKQIRYSWIILGILIIASIPFAPKTLNYIDYLLSYQHIQNTIPLFQTVQEFVPSQYNLSGAIGILGINYIFYTTIAIITIALLYCTYRKYKAKENLLVEIMVITTFYPLLYIGMGVAKYIPDLALVLVIGIAYVVDEIVKAVE